MPLQVSRVTGHAQEKLEKIQESVLFPTTRWRAFQTYHHRIGFIQRCFSLKNIKGSPSPLSLLSPLSFFSPII
jgi:hypothetical protein